jgi:hypothetical protein
MSFAVNFAAIPSSAKCWRSLLEAFAARVHQTKETIWIFFIFCTSLQFGLSHSMLLEAPPQHSSLQRHILI